MTVAVRPIDPADAEAWAKLRQQLWPSVDGHHREIADFFAGRLEEPQAVLLAAGADGEPLGFAELSIRPYAAGCSTRRVGYLEGWFVAAHARRRGIGRALVSAAEAWARARGCVEFASDTEVENTPSLAAHLALGFAEVERCICFRKDL